jgi:RNA polymerase sigma-70 factor (ECF subfamily)
VRFEELIDRHHDEIYGYLWRLLNRSGYADSAAEAQDLTQEVFLRAYQAFERLRPNSNHRAWLYKIATNCAYSLLKKSRRETDRTSSLSDEEIPVSTDTKRSLEAQVTRNETIEAIQRLIIALPYKQRAAVVLRHAQGLSYSGIAQALDCSADSARANVYQGLRRLRQELEKEL